MPRLYCLTGNVSGYLERTVEDPSGSTIRTSICGAATLAFLQQSHLPFQGSQMYVQGACAGLLISTNVDGPDVWDGR